MSEQKKICPYLGMADDPATNTSFPSFWNHCHKAKPVESVDFSHQQAFCLSERHLKCPVFQFEGSGSLPKEMRAARMRSGRKKGAGWKIFGLILIILAGLAFIVLRFFLVQPIIPLTGTVTTWTQELPAGVLADETETTQTPALNRTRTAEAEETQIAAMTAQAAAENLTETPAESPTASLSPTITLPPTRTQTPTRTLTPTLTPSRTPTRTITPTATEKPFSRSLDTPIGTDYKFVIHKIKSGENLSQYAATYKTSVEAILRVNYSLTIPLWVDALVVIPVDLSSVAQMPYFQPYRVTAARISVEAMAAELGADLEDFTYYNGFTAGEGLKQGDWVLVPRLKPAI